MDEIEQKTSWTKGDILECIEQGKLSLCASISESQMAAGKSSKGRDTIHAVFSYDGVVRLSEDISRRFSRFDKSQSVKNVQVLQPDRITRWGEPEDHFGAIPNSQLAIIRKTPVYDSPFFAFTKVTLGYSALDMIKGFAAQMESLKNKKSIEPNAFLDHNPKSLDTGYITIGLSQLRIDLQEIENLTKNVEVIPNSETKIGKRTDIGIITNPIEQIIVRILLENRELKADKIWVLMRKDVNSEGARRYDIDSVIDSMTSDRLYWFGKGINTENELSYDTFRKNTVYKVKKHLRKVEKT
ncbi:hypothetical protein [Vibrio barjaei]|uniref:hypothetical protein n=1 Tax=Vibrio barjaei TaxID=1676683 RepID=UPI00228533A5|nr:hypothetical protein [Vibrio barjaei]MCY9869684.1 hypothetical protein [Vibrio barjaei]